MVSGKRPLTRGRLPPALFATLVNQNQARNRALAHVSAGVQLTGCVQAMCGSTRRMWSRSILAPAGRVRLLPRCCRWLTKADYCCEPRFLALVHKTHNKKKHERQTARLSGWNCLGDGLQ